MSEYQYESTFDGIQTTETVKEEPIATGVLHKSASSVSDRASAGDLAAFVSHVSFLEHKLRTETGNIFFDTENEVFGSKIDIGEGASFRVQRAEWRGKKNGENSDSEVQWGKYVALKAVRARSGNGISDWREVLSEVRALLHEPLRYHPNVVRLLGLGWGPSADSSSIYPQLIMEFSEIGSMEALQKSTDTLPFAIKQKLCYDVGRGLSILHACGIIHGDLNHRNVLIFTNKVKTTGQPYTAKISDFGGSIMDMTKQGSHLLQMTTWPYSAPEISKSLTEEGIKKTDVYSFGLFIWRTVIDCGNILQALDLSGEKTPQAEKTVSVLKGSDSFLLGAKRSLNDYLASKGLHKDAMTMILQALEYTIQHDPTNRDLTRTQCVLIGMRLNDIPAYLRTVKERNERATVQARSEAPGSHGIRPDGLGAFLGKLGHDYDPQDNRPGNRPKLAYPEAGEFLFEPLRLKRILDWPQQQLIVKELERTAAMAPHDAPVELQPQEAAFYLFQCFLFGFGIETFDAERIVYWLAKATQPEGNGGNSYYAQAWIWRISHTFDIRCPMSADELESCLKMSIFRGHRTCLADGAYLRDHLPEYGPRQKWDSLLNEAQLILNRVAGGLGMPYFVPRKLRRDYNLRDIPHLDDLVQKELGKDYDRCLKVNSDTLNNPKPPHFESIFVNHIGHGLLHFAASTGNYDALLHMISKYHVDINIRDQTAYETPLVCACRTGNLKCALLLLDFGADPNNSTSGIEPPLHWLCSFKGSEMKEIAEKLISAGAEIDGGGGFMRSDVRAIAADWEHLFTVSTTNLGRAVIMNNLEAVNVLLDLGADPLAISNRQKNEPARNAVGIAALLNFPNILEILLQSLSSRGVDQSGIFDEREMLLAAHRKLVLPSDPTLLQSRIVRHGSNYKSAMSKTLQLLHSNREKSGRSPTQPEGLVLCQETRLANTDIVECLMELGHSPNGSPGHRPLGEAVNLNHEALFKVLIGHGADIFAKHTFENGSQLSLLQTFADRPKSCPPGLFIAKYLINAKVPVDSPPDGLPSAFALAVLAQDFELANLLLAHGADINHKYQVECEGPWFTVLGHLAQFHTAKSLASIEYLLSLSRSAEPVEVQLNQLNLATTNKLTAIPDFIVDKTNQLSILHILARCPHEAINNTAQISVRIIDAIMKFFKLPEQINYNHPIHGTALCLAALSSNLHMVSALLEKKAQINLSPPNFPQELKEIVGKIDEPAIPLHIALTTACVQFFKKDSFDSIQEPLAKLRDGMQIVELLYSSHDLELGGDGSKGAVLTQEQRASWEEKVKEREKQTKRGSAIQKLGSLFENHIKGWGGLKKKWETGDKPVDLSGMKDYVPDEVLDVDDLF